MDITQPGSNRGRATKKLPFLGLACGTRYLIDSFLCTWILSYIGLDLEKDRTFDTFDTQHGGRPHNFSHNLLIKRFSASLLRIYPFPTGPTFITTVEHAIHATI